METTGKVGAAVLGVAIALGGAYEVAVEDAVEVTYLDKADNVQKVARCVGDIDREECGTDVGTGKVVCHTVKGGSVEKCLPASAVAISVSAPRAKLLATSKATLAPEEQSAPCACAPWTPAKEAAPCEVEVKSMDGKASVWLPAPRLTTLSAGSWRGGCVPTSYGCTICQIRDLCRPGDPCFMDSRCRNPADVAKDAEAVKDPAVVAKEVMP